MSDRSIILIICALVMLSACSVIVKYPKPDQQKSSISFIQDGVTTRQEVIMKLGTPSTQYENDRILTYRLQLTNSGDYYVIQPSDLWLDGPGFDWWTPNTSSLILIFDSDGRLKNHKLVGAK